MPQYLIELYLPEPASECREQMVAAARSGCAGGGRYLRSIFLPGEETCFHEYESASAELLAEALARAELRYERLIEAHIVA